MRRGTLPWLCGLCALPRELGPESTTLLAQPQGLLLHLLDLAGSGRRRRGLRGAGRLRRGPEAASEQPRGEDRAGDGAPSPPGHLGLGPESAQGSSARVDEGVVATTAYRRHARHTAHRAVPAGRRAVDVDGVGPASKNAVLTLAANAQLVLELTLTLSPQGVAAGPCACGAGVAARGCDGRPRCGGLRLGLRRLLLQLLQLSGNPRLLVLQALLLLPGGLFRGALGLGLVDIRLGGAAAGRQQRRTDGENHNRTT